MPRCGQCSHEFAISSGFKCPSCGRDWRGAQADAPADAPTRTGSGGGGRPAHLAVLEAGGAPDDRKTHRRLVSSAGPAVPVLKQQNDSVPSGWTARLEAARGGNAGPAPSNGHAPPPQGPPPLKPTQKKPAARPAHLLVAQLEADEAKKRAEEPRPHLEKMKTADLAAVSEIAAASIDLPKAAPKRRWLPDWAWKTILVVVVVGGLGTSAYFVLREPPPKIVVDDKLKQDAERIRNVRQALNDGGTLFAEGKHDEAIAAYKRALVADPKEAKAERGLGVTYAAKGEKAEAVAHLKKYLELAPKADDADEVKANIDAYEKASAAPPAEDKKEDPPPTKKKRR